MLSAAGYDSRGPTLNSWGKNGHNFLAWYRSEFGLLLNIWHIIDFWHRITVVKELKIGNMIRIYIFFAFQTTKMLIKAPFLAPNS